MLKVILLLAIATLTSGCVAARRSSDDSWSTADTRREITYHIVNALDVVQTNEIRRRPDVVEANPVGHAFMGSEPQPKGMAIYFASLSVSHYLISRLLPSNLRRYWQVGTIATQGYIVVNNCTEYKLGC